MFWLVLVLAAALVALTIAIALRRQPGGADAAVAIYRDQLTEIDRDRDRGVLSPDEAERVRAEVARRLIEADRAQGSLAPERAGPGRWATLAVAALLLVIPLGLYAWIGLPEAPDLPLQMRYKMAADMRANRPSQAEGEARWGTPWVAPKDADPSYLALVEKLREAVKTRADETEGWVLLARHEAALGNYKAAAEAQGRLLTLKGDAAPASDFAEYGTLMVQAAGGYVSPEADEAFTRALKLDPKEPEARYFMGLMFAQTLRPDLAFRLWRPLLDEGPADAPWNAAIRQMIPTVAAEAGVRYAPPPPMMAGAPGPSAADVEAAGQMSAADRQEMIRGMVDRLGERLANEGGPATDWARLITALGVLGQTDRAKAILAEAETTFAKDAQGLEAIRAAGRQAGIAE